MAKKLQSVLTLLTIIILCNTLKSQNRYSPDFTNLYDPSVTCYWGTYDYPKQNHGNPQNGRHTLITTQGYDSNTNNQLPYLPPGEYKFIRLGNSNTGSEAEAISYRFTVDPLNSVLFLKFAVVFEDPDHPYYEQPRFVVKVTKPNGQLVESCAVYDVTAAGNIPGFQNGDSNVRWRPWTNVGIDLSSYIGQDIVVEFTTYDCNRGGHFGYAYYTAKCISNHLNLISCNGSDITLGGPDGFAQYNWSNGSTAQTTQFHLEDESLDAYCDITSVTGCIFRLNAHITSDQGLPLQDTVIYDTLCFGLPYNQNYFTLPEQNIVGNFVYLNTLCNINDCSYVTLTLMLNVSTKVEDNVIYDETCFGESYNDYNFQLDSLAVGEHFFQQDHVTPLGCDSAVKLFLTVKDSYKICIDDTMICNGYHDNGFDLDSLPAGWHFDTINPGTVLGCDSIVYLQLLVAPTYYITPDTDTICEGDDYTNYGLNIQHAEPGTYSNIISELETGLGCNIYDVSLEVTAKLKAPEIIYGPSNVFVVTDLLPGKYKYSIDPITGCDEYHWKIDNEKWGMYPNMNDCIIIVTTPEVSTLTVWASNSCNTVSKSIEIHADFFGVDENEAAGASVYPNPSDGYVNIEADGIEVVNIVNALGTVMKTFTFERENLSLLTSANCPTLYMCWRL